MHPSSTPTAQSFDPRALTARCATLGLIQFPLDTPPPACRPAPDPHSPPAYLLGQRSRPTPADIVNQVLTWYGLSSTLLTKRTRRAPVVWVRHVALYLLQDIHGLSEAEAGETIGVSRDIAGIAKRAVRNRCAAYPAVAADIALLRAHILSPHSPYDS